MQWISCVKVYSFKLLVTWTITVRHVGRMNMQVWMLNSLVHFAGWANSELVGSMRNKEWMICGLYAIFTVQFNAKSGNPFENILPSVYVLSLTETQNVWKLVKIVSALTWISLSIKFVVLRRRWKKTKKNLANLTMDGLPQASHGKILCTVFSTLFLLFGNVIEHGLYAVLLVYLTNWRQFSCICPGIDHTYIHTYNFICFSRLQKKAAYADVDLLKTYLKYLQHLIGLILQITLKYL